MTIIRTSLILLLLLPAVRCASPEPTAPKDAGNPVQASLKPAGGRIFTFGLITDAVMTIRNVSDRAIVVLNVVPGRNREEGMLRLSGSANGSVQQLASGEGYAYTTMPQQSTGILFHNGFLLPGQEVKLLFRYRPVSEKEPFTAICITSAARYNGNASSLTPLTVFVQRVTDKGVNKEFIPYTEKGWLTMYRSTLTVGDCIGPCISSRSLIIETVGASPHEFKVSLPILPVSDAFTIEAAQNAAARIINADTSSLPLAYCSTMGGYIVLEEKCSWVLKDPAQKRRGELLPPLPAVLAREMDDKPGVTFRIGDRQEGSGPEKRTSGQTFWGRYPVYYGDGMYTQGEFIDVNRADLPGFLKKAGENGGTLTRKEYYFGSGYYELVLPKR